MFFVDASVWPVFSIFVFFLIIFAGAVSEERCNEVESKVFDLFADFGATGLILQFFIVFNRRCLNSLLVGSF